MSRQRKASSNSSGESLDHDDFVVVQRDSAEESTEDNLSPDVPDSADERSEVSEPTNFLQMPAVKFINVQRVYPTDKDIRIRCMVVRKFKHSEMDSIGIYKLGWSDPRKAIAIEYVQSVQRVEQFYTNLRSCFLPSNPTCDEYYQFCYICQDGKTVMGTSEPFHLIRSIKSSGRNTLQQFAQRPETLIAKDDSLGTSLVAVVKPEKAETPEICSRCTELNSFKNRLDAALQSKTLATSELCALQERHEHLSNAYKALTDEGQKIKHDLAMVTHENAALQHEKKQQEKTMNGLVNDLTDRTRELEETKEKLKNIDTVKDQAVNELMVIQADRKKLEKLTEDNEGLQERVVVLSGELNDLLDQLCEKDTLIASITSEMEQLNESVKKLTEERDELKQSIAEVCEQRDDVCHQLTIIQTDRESIAHEKQHSQEEVEVLKDDLTEALQELKRVSELANRSNQLEHDLEVAKAAESSMRREQEQLTSELHEVQVMIQSMTGERRPTLIETLEAMQDEKVEKERIILNMRKQIEEVDEKFENADKEKEELGMQISSLAKEMESLQHTNACLRSIRSSGSNKDLEDADTLLRYLPSITMQLLNLSNASPDHHSTINELRDMIRYLLTAHERMKTEVTTLRKRIGPE